MHKLFTEADTYAFLQEHLACIDQEVLCSKFSSVACLTPDTRLLWQVALIGVVDCSSKDPFGVPLYALIAPRPKPAL